MIATLRAFFRLEAAGGIVLLAAAALALVWVNSPAGASYGALWDHSLRLGIGTFAIELSLVGWVNDALMVLFFLSVGLEIKREMLEGQLSSLRRAMLPAVAAVGGMVAPGLIYAAITWSDPVARHGWAIPCATDIAFAVGVLTLIGSRVPAALKVFLLALAIMDDLGAIVLIALFYGHEVSLAALAGAAACLAVLIGMNILRVRSVAPYVVVGVVLWLFVLQSGVHATIAGVLLAFTIPLRGLPREDAPLLKLEHALHPWTAFAILPLFAVANAGVSFAGLSPAALVAPVPLGIALGLFAGKQIGVTLAVFAMVRLKLAALPEGAHWGQVYGVSALCGIGFTMSLFIGMLAFETSPQYSDDLRIGVLSGSLLSALFGFFVLRLASRSAAT